MIFGYQVVISNLIPKGQEPIRKHKGRRWDKRGTYHRRIQKKWNKRFGYSQTEQFLISGDRIYMSQVAADALKERT